MNLSKSEGSLSWEIVFNMSTLIFPLIFVLSNMISTPITFPCLLFIHSTKTFLNETLVQLSTVIPLISVPKYPGIEFKKENPSL